MEPNLLTLKKNVDAAKIPNHELFECLHMIPINLPLDMVFCWFLFTPNKDSLVSFRLRSRISMERRNPPVRLASCKGWATSIAR